MNRAAQRTRIYPTPLARPPGPGTASVDRWPQRSPRQRCSIPLRQPRSGEHAAQTTRGLLARTRDSWLQATESLRTPGQAKKDCVVPDVAVRIPGGRPQAGIGPEVRACRLQAMARALPPASFVREAPTNLQSEVPV